MDCIIVGAGAAGLMAAKTLAEQGKSVMVLEASQRLGGRIHTLHQAGFSMPVEAGAEFVHGQLPITLQLLHEGNITYVPVSGNMWQKDEEEWKQQQEETKDWDEVLQKMNALQEDMTIADFLFEYFGEEKYADVRESVERFAEGFDLADIFSASTFALRKEWSSEEEEEYRLPGGYSQLIDLLEGKCRANGVEIISGCRINHIEIREEQVSLYAADGRAFYAAKAIVAVSLGILQQQAPAENSIRFTPALPHYEEAFQSMGFGSVVKIAMEFDEPFWSAISSDVGFVFSNQQVPTWWTQLSIKNNLLTGWLGGPEAIGMQHINQQVIYSKSIESLSAIFDKPVEELESKLVAWQIFNWSSDLFAAGAYSYSTLATADALKTIMQPVQEKLWFAGEAIYNGDHPGTVEAALESGKQIAEKILSTLTAW